MQLTVQSRRNPGVSRRPQGVPASSDRLRKASLRPVPLEFPVAGTWSLSRSKRLFDILVAFTALLVLALPMLAIAICVRLTSRGPALFLQNRVGRGGRCFVIYKFRTMTAGSAEGPLITTSIDGRITPFGRWLRRFKLDELPQFYNVLRGHMSLVGPRPTLRGHDPFKNMSYRPGLTGPATLAFCRQEEMLSRIHPSQVESFYQKEIKPIKATLDWHYLNQATIGSDIALLASTFLACLATSDRATPLGSRPSGKSIFGRGERRLL